MNTPWLWLTVATGLAVRIGLPLLVLVTMVLVMRRLDKRWQSEAKRPAAPLTTAAEEPCWEASSCANPACNECVVHQHPETPCWRESSLTARTVTSGVIVIRSRSTPDS